MNLWHDFLTNQGKVIHKCVQYFPVYERHFGPWQNRSLTFLEIGVNRGGSLHMWQRYFGPMAKIIGIDINPQCKKHEIPGVAVRIGDQSDPVFLQSVIDEFGIPDVVLDDGSHQMEHISKTFDFLYPLLPKGGIYMVEDLQTAYRPGYGGGLHEKKTFINISKHLIDKLNAHYTRGEIEPDDFTNKTFSINFYDAIVVFEKGELVRRVAERTGNEELDGIPARRPRDVMLARRMRAEARRAAAKPADPVIDAEAAPESEN